MERLFIEASWFTERLKEFGSATLLMEMQDEILKNPSKGDVIQGTNGVRKLRIGDKRHGRGKSGGFRVLYLDLPDRSRTHLIYIYSKKEADDLSADGKKIIMEMVKQIKEGEP